MKKTLWLFFFFFPASPIAIKAQTKDSLKIHIGSTITTGSKNFLPLWLVANQFGTIADEQFDISTHVSANHSNLLNPKTTPTQAEDKLLLFYGADLYINNHFKKATFNEAYAGLSYKRLQLRAGRYKQIIGEVDPDLSSGSLGVSGNAVPIPEVSFSVPEYIDLPLTNGFIMFKGQISHGWMGRKRYMTKAFLHEKNLYIRFGKKAFKIYGGIQHYAIWGGRHGDFKTRRDLGGFIDVLLAKEANDGTVPDDVLPNRAGDHRGVIEGGLQWENDQMLIQLNNQTPFDMGQGIDVRNIDRLVSLNLILKNSTGWFKKLSMEFLHTEQMNDFYSGAFRESYYNNGVYKTGWEYMDYIIGTPLFLNRSRGSNFLKGIIPFDWDSPVDNIPGLSNIIINRVIGGHLGISYKIKKIEAVTKFTYMQNYGVYAAGSADASKSQFYSFHQLTWPLTERLIAKTAIGYDWGDLYNKNFGGKISIHVEL